MYIAKVDRGVAWFIPLGAFIANFIVGGLAKAYGIIMTEFMELLDSDAKFMTLAGGLIYAFMYSVSIVSIKLMERFGPTKVVMLGGLGAGLSVLLTSLSKSVALYVLSVGVLLGISLAFIYSITFVMTGLCFDKRIGKAIVAGVAGVSLGQMLFPLILNALIEKYSARGATLVVSAIMLHFCVTGALMPRHVVPADRKKRTYIRDNRVIKATAKLEEEKQRQQQQQQLGKDEKEELKKKKEEQKDIANGHSETEFKNGQTSEFFDPQVFPSFSTVTQSEPQVTIETSSLKKSSAQPQPLDSTSNPNKMSLMIKLLLFMFVCNKIFADIGDIGASFALPPYGEKDRGFTRDQVVTAISISGGADLVSRVVVGVMSDMPWCRRSVLLSAVFMFEGVATLLFLTSADFSVFCFCYALFGIGSGAGITLFTPVLKDLVTEKHFTNSFGILFLVIGITIAPGQLIIGYLKDMTGSYTYSLVFAGINLIASSLILTSEHLIRQLYEEPSYPETTTPQDLSSSSSGAVLTEENKTLALTDTAQNYV